MILHWSSIIVFVICTQSNFTSMHLWDILWVQNREKSLSTSRPVLSIVQSSSIVHFTISLLNQILQKVMIPEQEHIISTESKDTWIYSGNHTRKREYNMVTTTPGNRVPLVRARHECGTDLVNYENILFTIDMGKLLRMSRSTAIFNISELPGEPMTWTIQSHLLKDIFKHMATSLSLSHGDWW